MKYLSGLAVVLLLSACGGGSPPPPQVATPLFTTVPESLTVGIGSLSTFDIRGGSSPYTATSSNAGVAIPLVNGSVLTLGGVAQGAADISIRDNLGESIVVSVLVAANNGLPLFTTAPPNVTLAVGTSPTYSVGGGSSTVNTATSSNEAVATVNIIGSTLTITGVSTGNAVVVVTDGSGVARTINVLVAAPILAVTPNNATGIISDNLVATIIGGTPPFRASVGNTLVATANINPVKPNELLIQLLQAGSTVVTVLDANNQSVAYSLTSNADTPGIRLSPGAVTISEFDAQPISFTVFGAAPGTLNAFSSDVQRLIATVDGQVITVNTGTNRNRCVDADLDITITVIDSTRASGLATVTIRDNGGACP